VVCRVREVCPCSYEGDVFMSRNATRPAMKKAAEFPTEDLVLTYKTSQRDTIQGSISSCVRFVPIKEQMCRHTEICMSRCMASSLFIRLPAYQIAL
jgi:hypothetical protein